MHKSITIIYIKIGFLLILKWINIKLKIRREALVQNSSIKGIGENTNY